MGCDIHMHIEYKKGGRWICGDYFRKNPLHGRYAGEPEYTLVGFHDNRDYDLFATLANVRNYGKTDYISEPRGLPDDITDDVKAMADDWDDDGHSRSYLTLREIIDFNNTHHQIKQAGMISPEAAKALDEHGTPPTEWCQYTNIKTWVRREWSTENDVLDPLIEAIKQRAAELHVIWDFLWDRNPEEAYEEADNIRIVFWFDN